MSIYDEFRRFFPGHEAEALALLASSLRKADRELFREAILHQRRWKEVQDHVSSQRMSEADAQPQFTQIRIAVLQFVQVLQNQEVPLDFVVPDVPAIDPYRKPRVFISYRRKDSLNVVGRIRDHLASEFGAQNVFFDAQSIELAERFEESIASFLDQADVFVSVIGPLWVGPEAGGTRRIDQPDDYVRMENERALKNNLPVIPLFIEQVEKNLPENLPPSIEAILKLNGLPIHPDPYFDKGMEELKSTIKKCADERLTTV